AFIMNPVFAVSFMQRDEHLDRVEKPKMTRGFLIGMGVLLAIALGGYAAGSKFLGNLMVAVIVLCLLDKYVFVYLIAGFQRSVLPRFQNGYGRLVEIVVSGSIWRQVGIMLSLVLMFIGSIVALGVRKPKVDFFPKGDPKFIYTYLRMPVGTKVEVTDSVTKILEKRVYNIIGRANPDVESVITNVAIGAGDPTEATASGVSQSHLGKVAVAFKELSERTGPATHVYMDKIREAVKGIPGAEVAVDQEASGPPQQKPVAIEVSGDDYPKLAALSKKVQRYVDSLHIAGVEALRSDLQDRNPEIGVNINRTRANREGISTGQLGLEVRTAIYGYEASKFKTPDDEYP
ncbi:MAG: efflux RND transporter permease subunit, partial [Hymenobacter sp.]